MVLSHMAVVMRLPPRQVLERQKVSLPSYPDQVMSVAKRSRSTPLYF